jgi:hypothetical protein
VLILGELKLGIWIELGVFGLVFVFAIHQFYDLKQEKIKRERQQVEEAEKTKAHQKGEPLG